VIALAIAYHRPADEKGPVARYARGRDYHYAHRDRMRALRGRLLALDPSLETYAAVDTGLAMEKVWAERAGLGWIGKNGCLINPRLGSWLTLSVMFVDRAVDGYDAPAEFRCGDCTLCLTACPTGAFPAPGVVDARRCIAYHSIENHGTVRRALAGGRILAATFARGLPVQPASPEGDARAGPGRCRARAGRGRRWGRPNSTAVRGMARPGPATTAAPQRPLRHRPARDCAARVVARLIDDPAPSVARRQAGRWAVWTGSPRCDLRCATIGVVGCQKRDDGDGEINAASGR
jgi:ferredoxin